MPVKLDRKGTGISILVLAFIICISGYYFISADEKELPPSREAAAAALDSVISLALVGKTEEICGFSASTRSCLMGLESVGSPPTSPPTIECSKNIEGEGNMTPGIAFKLVGTLDSGATYTSTVLAVKDGDGAKLINAVFWGDSEISIGSESDDLLSIDCR